MVSGSERVEVEEVRFAGPTREVVPSMGWQGPTYVWPWRAADRRQAVKEGRSARPVRPARGEGELR